jgi:phosphoglycerol transferase MdoB-like AlkP superfamily enzyme
VILPRLRFFLLPGLLLLVLAGVFRAVFWALFRGEADAVGAGDLLRAFWLGFKFDLRLVLLLLLPALALSRLRFLDPVRGEEARRFWIRHLTVMATALVVFHSIDLGNYAYLGERLDVSALRYLSNPLISFGMVWESYPVVRGLLGLVFFVFLFRLALLRWTPRPRPASAGAGWKGRVAVTLAVLAYLAGLYGKVSYYPLRWSDAFFSTERAVSDLALNPVLFFADSVCVAEKETGYEPEELAGVYPRLAAYLGVEDPDPSTLSLARYVRPTPLAGGRPNIVLVLMESFAAHKIGAYGNPLEASPNFDRIASRSLFFPNFFTPRVGTARGVFATLTGIPDTITYRTASRNPQTVTHQLVLDAFEGYDLYYFLGGSANWANIRALFSHNLENMTIIEEGDFETPRVDVWGITDTHLADEANRVLREPRERPFFAFVHMAGNHEPFTIPKGIPGFEERQLPLERLEAHGFESLNEYNSFRLHDHSLGHFLRIAEGEDYFENTLFFILADNGTIGRAPHMPPAERSLRLGTFHVPFAIYAPRWIPEGRVIPTLANQIDVMATAAGAAGIAALNTTLGRNLLDPRFADESYGFFFHKKGSSARMALVGEERLLAMNADGSGPTLHAWLEEDPLVDLAQAEPARAREMKELAWGLYQGSRFLLYNNRPERYEGLPVVAPRPDGGEGRE